MIYTASRFTTIRRASREVRVGSVGVGGRNPIRIQSMTTTPTQDVAATVRQSIALAEAGCEIVRITAPNVAAAEALGEIRREFTAAGFGAIPLVADIHFLPQAAMEAVKHVEKVRINPGNYADKKKFAVKEYTDGDYAAELERLHEAFSPIVLRCRELGRAMRIGTNHGSLSDRIMNRYGDTPLGMVESALEFLRIAESHGFRDICLSMKASNPKVMIQAYRLMVARMTQEGMDYPLHLGVTEAGDGDDARIKSAIGIGSLLADGLGDTIRVSLTEDPVFELPVARDLARKAEALWQQTPARTQPDLLDPYTYTRRRSATTQAAGGLRWGGAEVPRTVYSLREAFRGDTVAVRQELAALAAPGNEAKPELIRVRLETLDAFRHTRPLRALIREYAPAVVWDLSAFTIATLLAADASGFATRDVVLVRPQAADEGSLPYLLARARAADYLLALDLPPERLPVLAPAFADYPTERLLFTLSEASAGSIHAVGRYRMLSETLDACGMAAPIWIRATAANAIAPQAGFGDQLLEASILAGALLCDGVGDLVGVETVGPPRQALTLAYDILQGARTRSTKTEFVACPSCGRTLFDLQTTTQRIRAATGHLKGVTIAVMGCIVNGPGEMADADFGYVGGAPGKINLYVGKQCVRYNIASDEAVEALIALIREHGKWVDPVQA